MITLLCYLPGEVGCGTSTIAVLLLLLLLWLRLRLPRLPRLLLLQWWRKQRRRRRLLLLRPVLTSHLPGEAGRGNTTDTTSPTTLLVIPKRN
jgi:hypothetical protein